jgi:hypothetical protein
MGREAHNSPVSSINVKNSWRYTFSWLCPQIHTRTNLPTYIFIAKVILRLNCYRHLNDWLKRVSWLQSRSCGVRKLNVLECNAVFIHRWAASRRCVAAQVQRDAFLLIHKAIAVTSCSSPFYHLTGLCYCLFVQIISFSVGYFTYCNLLINTPHLRNICF